MENRVRHRQGFLVLLALLAAWVTAGICAPVFAESFDGRYMEGAAYQDDRVSRAFDTLRALGEASNTGGGKEEALRQACALFQEQGTRSLRAALDENFHNRSLLSGFSDSRLGSVVYAQGHGAISNALQSSCAALTGAGGNAVLSGFDADTLKDMTYATAFGEGLGFLQSSGLPFTGRLEVSGSLFGRGASGFEVLTVQPLWHDTSEQNHIFTQLSWNRTPKNGGGRKGYVDGDVFNAGLAWRRLSEDRSVVYGLNAFIDHAPEMNHNRMSVGADVQTEQIGVLANKYIPLSGWKSVDSYKEERAASGFDLELQGRLPEFPSWQANLKGFQWSSNEAMEGETTWGYDAGLQWQPVNALLWEAGLRNEQDASPQFHTQVRMVYKFGEPIEKMWERPVAIGDMSQRVYDKVRRDNAMRVEQRVKDSAYVTVTQTIGANTALLETGVVALSVGQQLPRPLTVTTDAAPGSVARLVFRDGGVLTIGAGSQVRVEATLITLLSGSLHYVSGTQNVVLAAPGATVTLLGTDVDLSTDGTTSTLRVRDGSARLDGTSAGSVTLGVAQAAASVSGVVGAALATNDPVYTAHTDTISEDIDRAASPQTGAKIAPYPIESPRLTATTTTPGQPITIALRFNGSVTVAGGVLHLVLDINGNTRHATLSGGSGTDDLTFTYTLQAGDGGATTATVQSFDLNGATITGNGKVAVTTVADTVLNLGGSVSDIVAPSGYAVAFTTDPISISNHTAAAFQITGAEIGATFDYTINSNNGGTDVTGSGTITTATQNVTGLDLSGLADGTLTVSLTLTDAAANTGAAVTNTVSKDIITLALDFVNGTYQLNGTIYNSFSAFQTAAGATFTRASPATTYAEDSSGNLVSFAANTPRITDKGILIEESRTNLSTYSDKITNFSGSGFGYSGAFLEQFTVNSATSPIGDLTASVATATGRFFKEYGGANAAYTCSFYSRNSSGGSIKINVKNRGSDIVKASQNFALTANWQRYSLTAITDGVFTGVRCEGNNYPANTQFWGMQIEQAGFPTSYIPTTTAAVTRSADSFMLPTGAWYGTGNAATWYAYFDGGKESTQGTRGRVVSPHSASVYLATGSDTMRVVSWPGAGGEISKDSGADFYTTPGKGAFAYNETARTRSITARGLSPATGTYPSGSYISAGTIGIGRNSVSASNMLNGHIRELSYRPRKVSDAELQSLTAP